MESRLRAVWLLATVILLPLPAVAGESPGSIYVTPMVHGTWTDDSRGVADDYTYTLATGQVISEGWDLELSLSRGKFDDDGGNDLEVTGVGVNALRVFYRESLFSPYLLAGVGWEEENTEFDSTDHDPYADIAFGLQLHSVRQQRSAISVRGEVRGRHTFIGHDDRLVDYMVGLGVQFAFGGTPASADERTIAAVPVVLDTDADGIRDDTDRCANTPPGARIDETGCERDSDHDGILDSRDKCPGTRPGITVDAGGCEADTDQDGVLESRDRCPNTPRGDKIGPDGCSLSVRLEVSFETNSAELRPESTAVLDRVAAVLRDVPSITGTIEGHTDSVGAEKYNLQLSQRRADRVREYLVDKGVAASRLTAQGFGELHPVADNSTAEGRAQNRRVILRRTDQP